LSRNRCPHADLALRIEKTGGNLRGEITPRRLAKRCRLRQRPERHCFEKPRTIGFQHDGVQCDVACIKARICANRRFAGAIENPQKSALRRKRHARRRIENRREECPSGAIARPRGDGNRTLPRRSLASPVAGIWQYLGRKRRYIFTPELRTQKAL
jgi:hypothetical protein